MGSNMPTIEEGAVGGGRNLLSDGGVEGGGSTGGSIRHNQPWP